MLTRPPAYLQSMFIVCSGMTVPMVDLGFGRHVTDIPTKNFAEMMLLLNIAFSLNCFMTSFSKTAIALMVWRIGKDIGWMRYSLIFAIVSTNLIFAAGAIQPWVRCSPVQKNWNPLAPGGECYPLKHYINMGIAEFGKYFPAHLFPHGKGR